ncbi:MAG: dTDP-4-dehydro-6-deoxyglucose aminotransferase [Deltaproteobacteria bacterium]|nr:dTDP-4-dehydro-6-deoxyglucose aminotransferase [Deltaproteobacteria bacterium]
MKRRVHDLAVMGGAPAFDEHLHVGRPNIGDRSRFLERMNNILDRRWLTNQGVYVNEFENRVAEFLGVRHCIAMCNGTVGLEIAIRALGLTGEVILPSFTFVATAHALQWQEITPVFCDIEPDGHCIDPLRVEEMITPRTSGIIGVHLWGAPCRIEELSEIARRRNLKLLFDASHAFGCSHLGKMIGSFGDCEVFSFHATKCVNTFEGGAVVTDDDGLAAKIRLMKNFGFQGYDNVIYIGTNGKMDEASAAMGLTSLESMGDFIAANKRNFEEYERELAKTPGVRLLPYDRDESRNFQYMVVEIDEERAGLNRDELLFVLHAERVLARRYFYPGCHRMEPYRSYFPHAGLLLPITEKVCRRVLSLPTGQAVGTEQVVIIADIIRVALSHAAEVRSRLSANTCHTEKV